MMIPEKARERAGKMNTPSRWNKWNKSSSIGAMEKCRGK